MSTSSKKLDATPIWLKRMGYKLQPPMPPLSPFGYSGNARVTTGFPLDVRSQQSQQILQNPQNAGRSFSLYDYLVKPVYNVGDFGEDVVIPFDQDTTSAQAITFSTSTFARTSSSIGGTTYYDVDEHTTALSNNDTGLIRNLGNNTQFTRLYSYTPDMDAVFYKLDFNLAFGLNVSAFTSGTIALTSANINIYVLSNNFLAQQVINNTYTSGLGNLVATGSQVFIVNDDIVIEAYVREAQQVIFSLTTTTTVTGTNTRQEGLIDWFPYLTNASAKTQSRSEITVHVHAAMSHADKVMRNRSNDQRIDYSGIRVDGDRRM